MPDWYHHLISDEQHNQRLDQVLSGLEGILSRSQAQRLIKQNQVLIEQEALSPAYKVKAGQIIRYQLAEPEPYGVKVQQGDLDVLFEDEDLVVINKQAGLVVHPAAGHAEGTLVNYLMHHCQHLSGIGGVSRPGIVHRLDKDTSGVLVVAKSERAHLNLVEQFQVHSINRRYYALVWKAPEVMQGTLEGPIGRNPHDRKKMAIVEQGKHAVTHWKRLERFEHFALVECRLETGRTHQIRVHFSSHHHPLVGDPLYGANKQQRLQVLAPALQTVVKSFQRQALHASVLGFEHPATKQYLEFTAPWPSDFGTLLCAMRQHDALKA